MEMGDPLVQLGKEVLDVTAGIEMAERTDQTVGILQAWQEGSVGRGIESTLDSGAEAIDILLSGQESRRVNGKAEKIKTFPTGIQDACFLGIQLQTEAS